MQIVAEMWLIVQLTGSGLSVGFTAALQFLPLLLFGAWGGLLAPRRRRTCAPPAAPNYRRYFAGQVVSISGNWMQIVAEMWLIVQLTGSGLSVGFTAALQFLPILLFGAWGGLLADRFPKRRLLMVTQSLMVLPALALWALTAADAIEVWMVYALVFA